MPYRNVKGVRLAADGLSRHLRGDVITLVSPPRPLPDGEGTGWTLVSVMENFSGVQPSYKEFAGAHAIYRLPPPCPLPHGRGSA